MITDHDLFDDQAQHLLLLSKGKMLEASPDLLGKRFEVRTNGTLPICCRLLFCEQALLPL
jgi:hypothetical protein